MSENPEVITNISNALKGLNLPNDGIGRSNAIINAVRIEVEKIYHGCTVYCKTPRGKDDTEKGSEFLWDIAAVKEKEIHSHGNKVTFKSSIEFACEIENQTKPTELLHDFSKLIFCDAPVRLFLGGENQRGVNDATRQLHYLKEAYGLLMPKVGEIWLGFYDINESCRTVFGGEIKKVRDFIQ